jgi:hypothetical protein
MEGANLGQRESIQDGAHRMLADTEMHVAAARRISFKITGALECEPGFGGWGKICSAADQPGIMRRDGVYHLARRIARGEALRRSARFIVLFILRFTDHNSRPIDPRR